MRNSMVETIYQLRRKSPSKFPGAAGQEASTQDSFQSKHSKIPHFRSGELNESIQDVASSAADLGMSESSTITLESSVNGDEIDEHKSLSRREIDLNRREENQKTEVGLNSDDERVKLQKAHETKGEFKNPSLPIHGKTPLELEPSPMAIAENGIPIPDSREKSYWPLEVLRHPQLSAKDLRVCASRVIETLKTAVDGHETLQHRARYINYGVHMVGCTPKNSRPSILLFCQENDKNRLKRLLDPEFLERIKCRSPYRSKARILSWASLPENPDLWIYIFPFITNPTKRLAGTEHTVVSLKIMQASSFCGALVEYQGRVATVGLTVEIDGIARLLTVDHIFEEDAPEEHSEGKDDDNESLWDYDSGDEGEEMFSIASDALELSQNDARLTPVCSSHEDGKGFASESRTYCQAHNLNDTNTHQPVLADKYTDQGSTTATSLTAAPTVRQVSAHRLDGKHELPHRHAYLDWACLELNEEKMERYSKSCISTDPDKAPVLLEEIGDAPTSHATSVLMISGIKGIRSGKLIADAGYLGSLRRQDMCVVWTLILDSAPGLVPGECGAVVVDQETYKIYGHVVGANVLGHAYVVPFRGVLDQIKTAFGTDLVHFPCKSSPLATWNLYSDEDLLSRLKDKKSRSNHAKAPGPEPDSVPSKKSTAIASARDIDPYKRATYSSAGSIYGSGTSYANPRYVAESRKKRDYALRHTGVAPPDLGRPAHDRMIQAALNLPSRTLQASSRPVAYPMQLDMDGSDDESYRGSSNHGHDGPMSGGKGSSSDHGSSTSAYNPHSSGGQQSSSYSTSTSDDQGGSSYYGSYSHR